jgi:peptide/nickel transport system permease protein
MDSSLAAGLETSPRLRELVRFRRRLTGRPLAMVGVALVAVFALVAILAPVISPYSPSATHFGDLLRPPLSRGYLLGTDELGRDELTRLLWGSRTSLEASVFATALAVLVGMPIGLVSGYYRGWLDPVVMRLTDLVLAFPYIIVAVGLAAILGASLRNVVIALAVAQLPHYVRIARAEALAVREEDYVRAAVVVGAGDLSILRRHVLPNIFTPILVQATASVPVAILGEALLSFLGLGVQPPTPSWGTMLSDAQSYIQQAPYLALLPGLSIFGATLAFNLLGDGIRDLLDPRGFAR